MGVFAEEACDSSVEELKGQERKTQNKTGGAVGFYKSRRAEARSAGGLCGRGGGGVGLFHKGGGCRLGVGDNSGWIVHVHVGQTIWIEI